MAGRDIDESHRVPTPLEMLFDLTFVVAIAIAGTPLHHAVAEHHLAQGLAGYLTTFAAVGWAWMTFTWIASAYDTDDAHYRLCTMLQMVGVLVLAAGVPKASQGDFAIVTFGYVVMRAGLVALWCAEGLFLLELAACQSTARTLQSFHFMEELQRCSPDTACPSYGTCDAAAGQVHPFRDGGDARSR